MGRPINPTLNSSNMSQVGCQLHLLQIIVGMNFKKLLKRVIRFLPFTNIFTLHGDQNKSLKEPYLHIVIQKGLTNLPWMIPAQIYELI